MLKSLLSPSLLEKKEERKDTEGVFVLIQPNVVLSVLNEKNNSFFLSGTKEFCQKRNKKVYKIKEVVSAYAANVIGCLDEGSGSGLLVDQLDSCQDHLLLSVELKKKHPFLLIKLFLVEQKENSAEKVEVVDYAVGFEDEEEAYQKLYGEDVAAIVFNSKEQERIREIEEHLSAVDLVDFEKCSWLVSFFSVDGGDCRETDKNRASALVVSIREQMKSAGILYKRNRQKIEEIDRSLF